MFKSNLKWQSIWYTFFMVGAAVLGMLKLTVYAKLLDVEEFGLYSLVLSAYLFIMYAGSFGLNEALVKEGSISYGKGDVSHIKEMRDIALFYSSLGVVVVSFFIFVFAQLFLEKMFQNAVFLMILLAITTLEFNLVGSYVRVNHKFTLFAKMLFLKSLIVIILAWYIAPVFGVYGVIFVESTVFILLAIYVLSLERFDIDFRKAFGGRKLLKKAMKQGMPVMASTVIRNLALSLDRWVIVATLGLMAVAKYAFAMILYQVAMVGIGFISTILGTRWLSSFGANSSLEDMFLKIKKILFIIVGIAVVLAWPFFEVLLYFVELHYPQYADAEVYLTIKLVYIGVIFLTITYLLDWLFIASSNEKFLLRLSVFSLLLTSILMLYGYFLNIEIYEYALIFLIVRAVNFLLCLFVISRFLRLRLLEF